MFQPPHGINGILQVIWAFVAIKSDILDPKSKAFIESGKNFASSGLNNKPTLQEGVFTFTSLPGAGLRGFFMPEELQVRILPSPPP